MKHQIGIPNVKDCPIYSNPAMYRCKETVLYLGIYGYFVLIGYIY